MPDLRDISPVSYCTTATGHPKIWSLLRTLADAYGRHRFSSDIQVLR